MIPDSEEKDGSASLLDASQLASTLAHELRNPITTLLNLVYLLEHQFDLKHLDMMKRQLILCESIISNLLNYGRTHKPVPETVSIPDLANHVKSLLLIPSNIQVEIREDSEGARAWVDPGHLRQILINLIQNAMEALEEAPGRISV